MPRTRKLLTQRTAVLLVLSTFGCSGGERLNGPTSNPDRGVLSSEVAADLIAAFGSVSSGTALANVSRFRVPGTSSGAPVVQQETAPCPAGGTATASAVAPRNAETIAAQIRLVGCRARGDSGDLWVFDTEALRIGVTVAPADGLLRLVVTTNGQMAFHSNTRRGRCDLDVRQEIAVLMSMSTSGPSGTIRTSGTACGASVDETRSLSPGGQRETP